MNWSKYGLTAFMLVVILATSFFGGHFGYFVNGVPQGGQQVTEQPGFLESVAWLWESMTFWFYMVSFGIDGMPDFISAVFTIMNILTILLIASLIRGN